MSPEIKYCTVTLKGPRTRKRRRLEKILSDALNAGMKTDAKFQRELKKIQQQEVDRILYGHES